MVYRDRLTATDSLDQVVHHALGDARVLAEVEGPETASSAHGAAEVPYVLFI